MRPLEVVAAALMVLIIVLLLVAVLSRYVFAQPIVWIDEVVSIAFIWLTMLGAAIAMHRNEHLRLTLVVERAAGARARRSSGARAGGGRGVPGRHAAPGLRVRPRGVGDHARRRWASPTASASRRSPSALLAMLAVVLVYAWRVGAAAQPGASRRLVVAALAALCRWRCRRSWRSSATSTS